MATSKSKVTTPVLPSAYVSFLKAIKERIRSAQIRASLSANSELIRLYWDIGRAIAERQEREGWGAAVIPRLARDLHNDLPEVRGFSERNIKLMTQFYAEYPRLFPIGQPPVAQTPALRSVIGQKGQLPVAQLPWAHNIILMQKTKDLNTRAWYMQQTIELGWSRSVLALMIDNSAHKRAGKAVHNFRRTLHTLQSDLAEQTLKDPYLFDVLTLAEPFRERELEVGLLTHVE